MSQQKNPAPELTKPPRPVFFKRRDLFFVLALLLVAAVLFCVFTLGRPQGGLARVTVVHDDGTQTVTEVDLSQDAVLNIEGAKLPVTLQVQEGRIRFIHSQCPDHICENTGWLQYEGDEAICLPAGVWVRVERAQA